MKTVVISGSQPSYQDEMRRIAQIFRIMRILRSVNGTVLRIMRILRSVNGIMRILRSVNGTVLRIMRMFRSDNGTVLSE
jgi:hypothetical protein